ncbi:arginase [Tetragenococcus osmophilus]|uniref:Arginase n=1 Tax=Tetragenococcus osmophilus TaxID=526944 RepID=A0AA38CZI5_9ENTE|nr:arginase family protein [Tetragenococcus osmophilus]AYW47145.1 arginase [Tetragenococcus osmophilus]GMA55232.1 arginase [Alicyclobacillus contaminans]GMA71001.1 arginase [Tetragenococcus osmophilus]GMA73404.1 arginase [Tetragenococcus osmophilus]
MTKTIRIVAPDWQAGGKQEYFFGSTLLSWLTPDNTNQKEIKLDVTQPGDDPLKKENGVVAQSSVKRNVTLSADALKQEQPDKVITLGGNCLVSQAPFDYLHGKYGDDLGVIWIDAHPDISNPEIYDNEHAMVLGNLLGAGDPELSKDVQAPFEPSSFLYVGMQEPNDLEKEELKRLNLNYTVQEDSVLDAEDIQKWIKDNNFSKVVVHLDLDVLDPSIFRSLYFAEPRVTEFPSEHERMTPEKLVDILTGIFQNNEVVGLTIAEYLPWDAIYLKNALANLDIFD